MYQVSIKASLKESIAVKTSILDDPSLIQKISEVTSLVIETFNRNGKVLFCGNGGSAADAQHLAAEFSGRFYKDRQPLYAEALHVNTSYLTAVANDYGFEHVYARLIKGIGKSGDVLIGLSTSGNSQNIIQAFRVARSLGMICVGFTGHLGGLLATESDILLNIPSTDTPRIQESHITVGHIICELVEKALFP
ncbi:MAG: D-sedoheptulose 7-phosphate isomerase [Saprospiraceae bacterium]|nr:D-sedoheptulose 7-phosphate isomerase [Saprospiraceae bacterium]